jgi:hypothetical protein
VEALNKSVLAELKDKYSKSKLFTLDKVDLIDIVHKAKCGMLQGLDTNTMTKNELIEHLYKSKCPEVHTMLLESVDVKHGIERFIVKLLEDKGELTINNIYYTGLQEAILGLFFYDAWKTKRYNCVLDNQLYGHNINFTFLKNDIFEPVKNIEDVLENMAEQIIRCAKKGVKVIAIPFSLYTHENAILYRVDSNTFERYEPHGSATGMYRHTKDYYKKQKGINDFKLLVGQLINDSVKYKKGKTVRKETLIRAIMPKDIQDKESAWWMKHKNHGGDFEERDRLFAVYLEARNEYIKNNIVNIYDFIIKCKFEDKDAPPKLIQLKEAYIKSQMTTVSFKVKVDNQINESLKEIFTVILPSVNSAFNGAKYITPDIITPAINGLQAIEPDQLQKKYHMTDEEYENRVGGFCMMWSMMYFDLVFRFPDVTPAVITQNMDTLLKANGEYAFGEIALGYLEGFKKLIFKYIGDFDFTDFDKRNPARDEAMIRLKSSVERLLFTADDEGNLILDG